ncbi:hypothetical protein HQ560_17410, partial [bacterium]|nr:hypothetical protein [bacterium]
MDDLACASCRKVLSLEEVERGNFKHLGGSLYCAECVAKMRRVGPTACSACGTTDTPLYNGKAYVCRKCGARLKQDDKPKPPPAKPQPAPAAAPRPKREGKSCPYCNGIIPAQALKCRYCGSHLTRDARDVEALSHQNLRLRFWLGSLLTASVFLFLILIYIVTRTPEPPDPADTPVKASAQDTSRIAEQERKTRDLMAKIQSLEDERAAAKAPPTPKQDERLTALQQELAALRREMAARDAKAAPIPAPPTPIAPKKAPEPKAPAPPPVKNKKGNPPPVPSPHPRIAVPPPPSPVPPKTADTAKA